MRHSVWARRCNVDVAEEAWISATSRRMTGVGVGVGGSQVWLGWDDMARVREVGARA